MIEQRKMSANDALERFKSALSDTVSVIEVLAPMCKNTDDLAGVIRLALENEGQLLLLFSQVFPNKK